MWIYLTYIIIGIYGFALFMISIYSISQLFLLFSYIASKRKKQHPDIFDLSNENEIPFVTIQLPVFNEKYVMKRLLFCISKIDYPRSKLEIQVLDDSDDNSINITSELIDQIKNTGIDISHIRRNNRFNFKAGALKEGLKTAKGEFIAVFDADFLPHKDWLKKTVIHFKNPMIGLVQTRWGHLNRDYSLLTKVQAYALDIHFTLEQAGRNAYHYFINFNGTAGIWRKECILNSGNWHGDTLTEDLDLSYRAQLKNWKFKYLENVVAPAELPVLMSAARSQQFRWNKGGAQNLLKMFRKVLASKTMPIDSKIHAILHLSNSSMFLFVLIVSVLSIPILYIKNMVPDMEFAFRMNSIFFVSTIILFVNNWIVYKSIHLKMKFRFVRFITIFFTFFTVSLGLSLHNSLAVIEAYRGKKSEFVRTPKFNIKKMTDKWKGKQYIKSKIPLHIILEICLLFYFVFGLYSGFILEDYTLLLFHFMLVTGFGYVIYTTFRPRF